MRNHTVRLFVWPKYMHFLCLQLHSMSIFSLQASRKIPNQGTTRAEIYMSWKPFLTNHPFLPQGNVFFDILSCYCCWCLATFQEFREVGVRTGLTFAALLNSTVPHARRIDPTEPSLRCNDLQAAIRDGQFTTQTSGGKSVELPTAVRTPSTHHSHSAPPHGHKQDIHRQPADPDSPPAQVRMTDG